MFEPTYKGQDVTVDFLTPLVELRVSRPNDSPLVHNTIKMEFDRVGNLWIADANVGVIQMFSDGDDDPSAIRFVNGQNATLSLNLTSIGNRVTLDDNDNLWVHEYRRILMYSQDDIDSSLVNSTNDVKPRVSLAYDQFGGGLRFDSAGNLWATHDDIVMYSDGDNDPRTSLFVDRQNSTLILQSARDTIENRFSSPSYTSIDQAGSLWVYTAGYVDNRILMFSDGDTDPSTIAFVSSQNATMST